MVLHRRFARGLLFFFECYVDHRVLHSFPTRRSSDLRRVGRDAVEVGCPVRVRLRREVEGREQAPRDLVLPRQGHRPEDRKSTRLNSSHMSISYAVFCLKKKNKLDKKHKIRYDMDPTT